MSGIGLENEQKALSYEQLKKSSTFSVKRKKADRKTKEPAIFHMTAKELSCEKSYLCGIGNSGSCIPLSYNKEFLNNKSSFKKQLHCHVTEFPDTGNTEAQGR